jgi:TonB family protein
MEDRVAEVLAQRAALDNGFAVGGILSLLLHGGIAAAAIYAATHAQVPAVAPVLNIRFAPMPSAVVAKPAPAKPAAPRIEAPKPQPLKPVETKKAVVEKNTVPLSPFGKSTKKGSEHAPPVAPATPVAPINTTSPVGVTALEGGNFPYTLYIDRMTTLIGQRWLRPQIAGGPAVVVYFVIERDGTIRDTRVETPSGNDTFDRAAIRAVRETGQLGPLPFGYSGTYLGVHLTFR